MFNAFANDGVYVEPYCIKWVKNGLGEKIFKNEVEGAYRVISSRISGQVSKVLQLSLKRIKKNYPQKWFNCEAIGKTGTTNDSRVCWFIGSTPTLTTGVYIGRDDNKPLGKNIYPIRTAFPIWIGLNREIDFENKKFSYDSSLKEICINSRTGQVALNATDPDAITIFV
jgi:penicillin-binding protein 1A